MIYLISKASHRNDKYMTVCTKAPNEKFAQMIERFYPTATRVNAFSYYCFVLKVGMGKLIREVSPE